jgi:AmmeMemoRadiSam system protein B
VLASFALVPLVVGAAAPDEVAAVLERLWGGDETLVVISSDLSHFHDYATAQRLDRATSERIEALDFEHIDGEGACGVMPLRGLLLLARQRGLELATIDLRSSGDTAGPRREVVGYGSYVVV